jgi:glycosyltransferase involved in cell wall biosynthesis
MNIVYVTYGAALYGANTSLINLMLNMREKYNANVILLVNEEGPLVDECRNMKISVIVTPFYRWLTIGNSPLAKLKNIGKIFLNIFKYREALAKVKNMPIDIIHTNSTVTDIGAYLSKKIYKPHVWHLREYGIDDYNMYYMFPDFMVMKKYNRAAAVIAISNSIFNTYVNERKLCTAGNTRVIYNGIQIPNPYKKSEYVEKKRTHFCIVGVVSEAKGHTMAIEACKFLQKLTGNYVLDIIGDGDAAYVRELKENVKKYELTENVRFWGYRSDIADILKTMDVGLMLSKKEAFGRVTVEYMLNYMPVIGTNSGGTPEIIRANQTGYLIDFDQTELLAEKMKYCITNSDTVKKYGEYGRKVAIDCFSVARNTEEIFEVYTDVLH